MSSKVYQRGPVAPEMNITPLIDVVFLLIIFFMLVNNITTQESVKLIPPQVKHSVAHEMKNKHRIVVNLITQTGLPASRKKSPLNIPGRLGAVKAGLQLFAPNDLAGFTAFLEKARKKDKLLHVLLRGDAALQYKTVQPVIEAIAKSGIKTIDIVASTNKKGGA